MTSTICTGINPMFGVSRNCLRIKWVPKNSKSLILSIFRGSRNVQTTLDIFGTVTVSGSRYLRTKDFILLCISSIRRQTGSRKSSLIIIRRFSGQVPLLAKIKYRERGRGNIVSPYRKIAKDKSVRNRGFLRSELEALRERQPQLEESERQRVGGGVDNRSSL